MTNGLLFQAGRPDGHGVRRHSLMFKTNSALVSEVTKYRAISPQLAIQGNYRALAARDMDKVYSRILAHPLISAAQFPQKDSRWNKDAESIVAGQSVFSEERTTDKNPGHLNFWAKKPAEWDLALLKTGIIGCLKRVERL